LTVSLLFELSAPAGDVDETRRGESLKCE
jgi:hypothetical protein